MMAGPGVLSTSLGALSVGVGAIATAAAAAAAATTTAAVTAAPACSAGAASTAMSAAARPCSSFGRLASTVFNNSSSKWPATGSFPFSLRAYSSATAAAFSAAAVAPGPTTAPLVDAHGPPPLAYDEIFVDHRTLTAVDPPPARAAEEAAGGRGPLTAVFLHGLLGSGKNWRSFSKGLAVQAARAARRDVRSLLVDLRGHGDSAALPGLHPPHTVETAGADVVRTLRSALGGAPHVLVGLSLGGKVALDVLQRLEQEQREHCATIGDGKQQRGGQQQHAQGQAHSSAAEPSPPPHRALPLHCWVLDSQPGTVASEEDAPTSVAKILSLIARMQMPVANRQALQRVLAAEGLPPAIAGWLANGLVPAGGDLSGPLRWGFDPMGAAALYASYRHSSYWGALERPPPGVTVHVVRGERSDRWPPAMLERLQAAQSAWQAAEVHEGPSVGRLRLHVLPDAGHWLQADNPQGLAAMMLPTFRDEPGV